MLKYTGAVVKKRTKSRLSGVTQMAIPWNSHYDALAYHYIDVGIIILIFLCLQILLCDCVHVVIWSVVVSLQNAALEYPQTCNRTNTSPLHWPDCSEEISAGQFVCGIKCLYLRSGRSGMRLTLCFDLLNRYIIPVKQSELIFALSKLRVLLHKQILISTIADTVLYQLLYSYCHE